MIKGWGILSLGIPTGLVVICELAFQTTRSENIALIVGGGLVLLIGLGAVFMENQGREKGTKLQLMDHSFLFIPMFIWGIISIGLGIYLLL